MILGQATPTNEYEREESSRVDRTLKEELTDSTYDLEAIFTIADSYTGCSLISRNLGLDRGFCKNFFKTYQLNEKEKNKKKKEKEKEVQTNTCPI